MKRQRRKSRRTSKELNARSASFLRSFQWKSLRVKALNRDGCKCVLCGCHEGLSVHHILERKHHPELALELDNLVTLCAKHHAFGPESVHRGCGCYLLWEHLKEKASSQWTRLREWLGM